MNNYATFWQRFASMWIDNFVLLPITALSIWAQTSSKTVSMVLMVPVAAVTIGYFVYCHGRYGRTIGKRATGIRVIRTDGERIGFREAWLRDSVVILFTLFDLAGSFVMFRAIPDSEFYGVGWMQQGQNLQTYLPVWARWISWGMQAWIWSEVIVMLFNKQRRSLHDFIAGTIVVSERNIPAAQPSTPPAKAPGS